MPTSGQRVPIHGRRRQGNDPFESDVHKSDLVVNQHIMQMIDTDIHWYEQTLREIIMELRNIRNGETPTKTSEESNKTAMMCWESLDDSEQASKKQKLMHKTTKQTITTTKWTTRRPQCLNIQQIW